MVSIKHVKASEDISIINEILEQDGCIVLKDAIPQDRVQLLEAELEPYFVAAPYCNGDFYGHVTKRLSSLVVKSCQCQFVGKGLIVF